MNKEFVVIIAHKSEDAFIFETKAENEQQCIEKALYKYGSEYMYDELSNRKEFVHNAVQHLEDGDDCTPLQEAFECNNECCQEKIIYFDKEKNKLVCRDIHKDIQVFLDGIWEEAQPVVKQKKNQARRKEYEDLKKEFEPA